MSHTCQFYLCTTPADEIIHVQGKRIITIHVCSRHRASLVSTIKREFGKDKVMSEDGTTRKEQYEHTYSM